MKAKPTDAMVERFKVPEGEASKTQRTCLQCAYATEKREALEKPSAFPDGLRRQK
jgi:hypothetical protein